jgi:hypothetical protein
MKQALTRVLDVLAKGLETLHNTLPASSHITLGEEIAVHMVKRANRIFVH